MMIMNDIVMFVVTARPDLERCYIEEVCDFLFYHLEEKIRCEVLHFDQPFNHKDIALLPPYDDVYWRYVLAFIALQEGKLEVYREQQKLFEQAWDNFCRQAFLQKENFKLSPLVTEEQEAL